MSERTISNFKAKEKVTELGYKTSSLKKIRMAGVLLILSGAISLGGKAVLGGSDSVGSPTPTVEQTDVVNINIDDLKTLNVVFVNDGIDDAKMSNITGFFQKNGLNYEVKTTDELKNYPMAGDEIIMAFTNYQGDKYKVITNRDSENKEADLLAAVSFTNLGNNVVLQDGVYDVNIPSPTLIPSNLENIVAGKDIANVTFAIPEEREIDEAFSNGILKSIAYYSELSKNLSNDDKSLLRASNSDDYKTILDNIGSYADSNYDVDYNSVYVNSTLANYFENSKINITGIEADYTFK